MLQSLSGNEAETSQAENDTFVTSLTLIDNTGMFVEEKSNGTM